MKILYSSNDVHNAIKKIFGNEANRRVAIVAYVGKDACSYLPSPRNMEIICCPEPGATSPNAVRELIDRGATVKFSDGLHSKVYWSDLGCIITSANVSYRALGSHPQKEVGVLLESENIDIDRLLKISSPYDITREAIDSLDVEDRKLQKYIKYKSEKRVKVSFIDWFNLPYRPSWKLGWWSENDLHYSTSAVKNSINEYAISEPQEALNFSSKQVKEGDWILCYEIGKNGVVKSIEWMYVDFVVKVNPSDKGAFEKKYPYQAIQVFKLSKYPIPPFEINKKFKMAFKNSVVKYEVSNVKKSVDVSDDLITLIHSEFDLERNNMSW